MLHLFNRAMRRPGRLSGWLWRAATRPSRPRRALEKRPKVLMPILEQVGERIAIQDGEECAHRLRQHAWQRTG